MLCSDTAMQTYLPGGGEPEQNFSFIRNATHTGREPQQPCLACRKGDVPRAVNELMRDHSVVVISRST